VNTNGECHVEKTLAAAGQRGESAGSDGGSRADVRPHRRRLAAAGATLLTAGLVSVLILVTARSCGDAETRDAILQSVCWLLVGGGVAGTFLAGRGRRWAWLVLFGLQPVWIVYAVITGQPGFVLGSLAYAAAQLSGYLRNGGA